MPFCLVLIAASFRIDNSVPVDYVGLSSFQRNWLQVALNEDLSFDMFEISSSDKNIFAAKLDLEVNLHSLHRFELRNNLAALV